LLPGKNLRDEFVGRQEKTGSETEVKIDEAKVDARR